MQKIDGYKLSRFSRSKINFKNKKLIQKIKNKKRFLEGYALSLVYDTKNKVRLSCEYYPKVGGIELHYVKKGEEKHFIYSKERDYWNCQNHEDNSAHIVDNSYLIGNYIHKTDELGKVFEAIKTSYKIDKSRRSLKEKIFGFVMPDILNYLNDLRLS